MTSLDPFPEESVVTRVSPCLQSWPSFPHIDIFHRFIILTLNLRHGFEIHMAIVNRAKETRRIDICLSHDSRFVSNHETEGWLNTKNMGIMDLEVIPNIKSYRIIDNVIRRRHWMKQKTISIINTY